MSGINFFHGLLESLFSKKIVKPNFSFLFDKRKESSLEDLIKNVSEAKGEVSALNYAEDLLDFLDTNNEKILIKFFLIMLNNFDLDINSLNDAIKNYNSINKNEAYFKITKFSEPKKLLSHLYLDQEKQCLLEYLDFQTQNSKSSSFLLYKFSFLVTSNEPSSRFSFR